MAAPDSRVASRVCFRTLLLPIAVGSLAGTGIGRFSSEPFVFAGAGALPAYLPGPDWLGGLLVIGMVVLLGLLGWGYACRRNGLKNNPRSQGIFMPEGLAGVLNLSRTVLDSMSEGVIITDPDLRILSANQAFLKLVGMKWKQIEGTGRPRPFWAEGYEDANSATMDMYLRGGHGVFQHIYQDSDGEVFPVEVSEAKLTDAEGQLRGYIAVVRDVSEEKASRRQHECSLAVMELLNSDLPTHELANEILRAIQDFTGMRALAIRLEQDGDFPCYAQIGLPEGYVEHQQCPYVSEKTRPKRCAKSDCVYGRVFRSDPGDLREHFTSHGTFWKRRAGSIVPREGFDTRHSGYETLAVLPLLGSGSAIGVLELLDPAPGRLEEEDIRFLEDLSTGIAIGLSRRFAEESLKQSEARYRAMVQSQPDAVCRWKPDGTLTFVNRRYCELVERSAADLIGRDWIELIPEKDRPELRSMYEHLLEHPAPLTIRTRWTTRDGKEHWLDWVDFPIFNAQGDVDEFQSVGRDVTHIKQTQDELRETGEKWRISEEFTRSVLDALCSSIAILDAQGTIVAVNRSWLQFGLANDAEMDRIGEGVNYFELCRRARGEDAPLAERCLKGFYDLLNDRRTFFAMEYPCHSPDIERWFAMFATCMEIRKEQYLVVSHENITVRHQMETTLRESEERYRSIFQNSPAAMLLIDPETLAIVDANTAAQKYYGYKGGELLRRRITEISVQPPGAIHAEMARIRTNERGRSVFHHRLGNGEVHPVEAYTSPVWIEGRVLMHSIVFDITDRLTAQRKLYRSLSQLREAQRIAGMGIWEYNVQDDILTWSDEMFRLFMLDPRGAAPTFEEAMSYYLPEDRQRLREAIDRVVRRGHSSELDLHVRLPSGEMAYHMARVTPAGTYDSPSNQVLCTEQDVTQRKQTERRLQRAYQEWEGIFQAIGQPAMVLDSRRRIEAANRAALEEMGKTSEEEVKGRPCYELMHGQVCPAEGCPLDEDVPPDHIVSGEITLDGRHWLVSCAPLRNEQGGIDKVIHITTDVTEQRRMQEEIATLSEQERLRLGSELHDNLGQQLSATALMLKGLKDKCEGDAAFLKKDFDKVLRQVEETNHRMRLLVHGLYPGEVGAAQLDEAMEDLAGEVSELARIQCEYRRPESELPISDDMANHLFRIAQEAVNNSLKYGRAESIEIGLSLTDGHVALRVADDGVGFEPDRINHAGRGMQIMRSRARILNGALDVNSRPGEGTTVLCRVPVPKAS
jgi:PAS domain S-box-containing protein